MRLLNFILPALLPLVHAQDTNGIGSVPADRHYINLRQATCVIAAAIKKAKKIMPENIAVVDPSGLLVAFARMDNAFPGSIDIAKKKALSTVYFNGVPSDYFLKDAYSGGDLYAIQETNGGIVVFKGGLPIYDGDFLIGGLGVSGATAAQDFAVAKAGVAGLCGPSGGPTSNTTDPD